METIKEMIARMCPEGVDKVLLQSIATITIGEFVHKDKQNPNAPYPVYNGGSTYTGFYENFNNTANKILISARGAAGFVNRVDCDYWAGNSSYTIDVIDKNANWVYVFYYLKNYQSELIASQQKGGGVPAVSKKQVENLEISLPPLPVQQEIVRILDTFTSLQSNLEAELTARQKQYEHYRNELLTFDKNDKSVEWKPMGEIGKLVRGNGLQKTDFTEEGIGCIHYGQIYTRLGFSCDKTLTYVSPELAKSLTKVEPGDIVMACTSENVEDVCKSVVWLGNETIVTGGHACVFKHKENPKYIGYCLLTNDFFNQKRAYAYGAKVIDIKTEKLALIQLPIPSLQRQQEIVKILDTFEATITNLKQEIEARKKQYEYYREQLLTFN